VRGRQGASPNELDELVARGLAASMFVGHAGIELGITPAGERVLAEIDAPPPSVYEVPEVREELTAFLAAWGPTVGEERVQPFKVNLAFLLDLAVAHALDLERVRLRGTLAAVLTDGATGKAVLAVVDAPPARPPRGRSSRSAVSGASRSR
jgi:hypothetical protein